MLPNISSEIGAKKITERRIELLQGYGFDWNPNKTAWDIFLAELVARREAELVQRQAAWCRKEEKTWAIANPFAVGLGCPGRSGEGAVSASQLIG